MELYKNLLKKAVQSGCQPLTAQSGLWLQPVCSCRVSYNGSRSSTKLWNFYEDTSVYGYIRQKWDVTMRTYDCVHTAHLKAYVCVLLYVQWCTRVGQTRVYISRSVGVVCGQACSLYMYMSVLINVCPIHVMNHICMSSYCPKGVSYSTLHLLYITSSDGFCMKSRAHLWGREGGLEAERDINSLHFTLDYLLTRRWWRYIKTEQLFSQSNLWWRIHKTVN